MADKAKIQRNGQAKWTFMVYMVEDKNIDGAVLRDIAEMARLNHKRLQSAGGRSIESIDFMPHSVLIIH